MAPIFSPSEKVIQHLKRMGEYEKFRNVFSQGLSLREMFTEFWEREDIMKVLSLPKVNPDISRKGDLESTKFRNEGNRLYLNKNFEKALLAYNYAVMSAVHPEEEILKEKNKQAVQGKYEALALAYASRSALLFEVGQFEECIIDIDRAIAYGYPLDKIQKLMERKTKCLQNKACGKKNDDNTIHKYDYIFHRGSELTEFVKGKDNKDLSMVNSAVKVEYSPLKGRHLVASRDIEPGEILIVEKAICSIPKLDSNIRLYCCICLKKTPILLPCFKCSLVAFCSDECRRSPSNNHAIECSILPILISLRPDEEVGLVCRTLLKFTMEKINKELKTLSNNVSNQPVIRKNLKALLSQGSTYSTLYNLEGNIKQRSGDCFLETVSHAILIVQLLQKVPEFWNQKLCDTISKDDNTLKTLGSEVMRLILNFQCNIHCLKELQIDKKSNILSAGCYEPGYGIFNTFSLMNHSCVPNALHSNWGHTKFMYTINFIAKGEEIFDSYGERYVSHDLKSRKENLKNNYYFDCTCQACVENWPKFTELPKEYELKCPKCEAPIGDSNYKCIICERVFTVHKSKEGKKSKKHEPTDIYDAKEMVLSIQKEWKSYEKSFNDINHYKTSLANIKNIGRYISLLSKYTCVPHTFFIEAQEALLRGYDLMGSYTFINPNMES